MKPRNTQTKTLKNFMAGITACAMLSACGTLESSVKASWKEGIRNYALKAVYPMREDIFVGSMRLVVDNDDDFLLNSRSLGYLDLTGALSRQEDGMPNLAPTPNATGLAPKEASGLTIWNQPTGGTSPRLRRATLPGVSVVRISGISGSTSSGLGGVATALGSKVNLSIDLTGIESAEISDIVAYRSIVNHMRRELARDDNFGAGVCASAATLKDPDAQNAQIQLVTRVFYARGINYAYGSDISAVLAASKGLTARQASLSDLADIRASLKRLEKAEETKPAEGEPPAGASADETEEPTEVPVGSQVNAGFSATDTHTLTEIFERPLGFGAQVLAFDVDGLFGMLCKNGVYDKSKLDLRINLGPVSPNSVSPSAQIPNPGASAPVGTILSDTPTCASLISDGMTPSQVEDQKKLGACK